MGEFWDNNDTKNYRVGFRKSTASPMATPIGTPRMQPVSTIGNTLFSSGSSGGAISSQQRTFSAPSSLKCTPVTGAAAPVVSRVSVGGSDGSRRVVTVNTAVKKSGDESESEVEKTPIEKDVEESEKKPATALPTAPIPLILTLS